MQQINQQDKSDLDSLESLVSLSIAIAGLDSVQVAEDAGFLLVTRRRCLLLRIVPWRVETQRLKSPY
jgi:hypothetical protein